MKKQGVMGYRALKDLKKLPNNPRVIRDKQFKALCESIRDNPEYFEARPLILSDRTGELVIIAGNQRYEAAKALKLKEAPTYLMRGLTEEKEREIIIRDNINNGEWDYDLLANEWGDLPLQEFGLELPSLTNIDDKEGKEESEKQLYEVVIECKNEKEMQKVYNKLIKEGYNCRPLIF